MKTRIKKMLLLATVLLVSAANSFAGSNEKGIEYYRAELYGAAKIYFMQQKNLSATEQAEAYYYLGQTYYKLNQVDSAQYFYKKAVEADPEYPFGYVGLGKLDVKNNPKAAEDLFKKAFGLAKKDASVPTEVAEIYIAEGNKIKAGEALERARKANKKYSGIFVAEGDALKKEGKVGEACSLYENAVLFDKNNKTAYLRLAQIYKGINSDLALQYLNQVMEIDPSYIPAYAEIGDINYDKGRYKAALEAYEKFIAVPGMPLTQHEKYAFALYFDEQYDKSQEEVKYVLSQDPDNSVMYRIEAYNNYKNKNFELGLEQMDKFIRNTPEEKHIYYDYVTLGDLQIEMKQPELAIESYKKALELDSTKTIIYDKLTIAAEKAKNFPLSVEYYEKSFTINPDISLMSLFSYGRANFSAASYYIDPKTIEAETTPELAATNEVTFNTYIQKGTKAFSDVITRKPDTHLGYLWRANISALVDSYNQLREKPMTGVAKPYYEEALQYMLENNPDGKRNEDIIQCYRYLASYYFVLEDLVAVGEYYKKILEIDPNDEPAKKILDMLKIKY
ncbi:MAG: tetratricopeptide repeat protein [Dysgonamonadaceae bacterium]|jgi:tetratricopeptide (TPR) repeat protein|nr:tetratricopeptide repeat protein [Dysgonamonadaceae bacterium]